MFVALSDIVLYSWNWWPLALENMLHLVHEPAVVLTLATITAKGDQYIAGLHRTPTYSLLLNVHFALVYCSYVSMSHPSSRGKRTDRKQDGL